MLKRTSKGVEARQKTRDTREKVQSTTIIPSIYLVYLRTARRCHTCCWGAQDQFSYRFLDLMEFTTAMYSSSSTSFLFWSSSILLSTSLSTCRGMLSTE